jgi:hypothetical protein
LTPKTGTLKFGRDSKKDTVDVTEKWIFTLLFFITKLKNSLSEL